MRPLFPIAFAATFVLISFALEELRNMVWRLTIWQTDVYLHYPTGYGRFLIPALTGFVIGCVFTAIDGALNRRTDANGKVTAKRLIRYGARSVLCAVGFWLAWILCWQVLLPNMFQHRRYHAYPPDIQWMNRTAWVLPFVFVLLLLWALVSALTRRPTEKL